MTIRDMQSRSVLVSAALILARFLLVSSTSAPYNHYKLDAHRFQTEVRKQTRKQILQDDARGTFVDWAIHHGKPYISDTLEQEQEGRFEIWKTNVAEHLQNDQNKNAEHAMLNGLMDLHDGEFRQMYLGYTPLRGNKKPSDGKANLLYRYRYVVPESSVDWREAGIVGPIKNQHVNGSKCGCCWSFATIGVVESINALATGKMQVLSEQQLIACDKKGPYFDLGCQGGDFEGGMKYIIDHGIGLESEYPYLAEDSKCDHRKAGHSVVTIDAVEDVPGGNETALEQAVTMHPVGIGLCVGDWIKEWRAYTGGIFRVPKNCEEPQDHAMPVVGYGTTDEGEKYWLLKNSWGSQWGEAGFLRLPRGMPGNGSLGLAANPGYPVKISANPSHLPQPEDWLDLRATKLR